MPTVGKSARQGFLQSFFSRWRFPKLFFLLVALFVLDLLVPDPIPFVDKAILALLAILLGMWKSREEEAPLGKPPEKNITPASQRPSA